MGKSKRLLGTWHHYRDTSHSAIIDSIRNGYAHGTSIWDLPPTPAEGKFRETVEHLQENYWKEDEE